MSKENNNMKNSSFSVNPEEMSVKSVVNCPEDCEEMVNSYGTYNIQPTANNDNDFPAIAQGTPPYMAKRSRKFYRGARDRNPAADTSDKHCL